MPENLIHKIHRLMQSERQEHPQADAMMDFIFQQVDEQNKKNKNRKIFFTWFLPVVLFMVSSVAVFFAWPETPEKSTDAAMLEDMNIYSEIKVQKNQPGPVFIYPEPVYTTTKKSGDSSTFKSSSSKKEKRIIPNTPSERIKNLVSSVALNHKPKNPVIITNPITHFNITDFTNGTGGDKILLLERPKDTATGADVFIKEIKTDPPKIHDPKIKNLAEN